MTKSKSTKRALLSSVLALVLTCSMLIGTTFAWFTDSVKSGKNKIVAGNLDVELEYATVDENGALQNNWTSVEGKTDLFEQDTLWEPGHAEVVYLRVRNAGTLALKYNFAMNIASETTATSVLGNQFKLSQYLKYGVVENQTSAFADRAAAIAAVTNPTALSGYSKDGNLLPDAEEYAALVVYMPETVGNEANYRGEVIPQIELGLTLRATQYTFEEDSWDNQYDKDAPFLHAATADEINTIIDAANPGDTVHIMLTDDAVFDYQQITVRDGKNLIFDGNGKTITASNMPLYSVFDVQNNGGKIVISDLTIEGNAGAALYFKNEEDVVLNNVKINLTESTTDKGYPIAFYGKGSATMNNVTVTGRGGTYYGYALFDADVWVGAEMNVVVNGGDLRSVFVNANRGAAGSITADKGAHIADVRLNMDGGPRATLIQKDCTIDLIQDDI